MSLSCDFTDLWPLTCPFVGERDREARSTGDGIRFSAAVEGLISLTSSRSSSESEEGKKRSGSLFSRVGAAGDGDGVNCIVALADSRFSSTRCACFVSLISFE